jgi:hypothetical protein
MTANLLREYLTAFDNAMSQQNRHVLLLIDNASCHPEIELNNVTLKI